MSPDDHHQLDRRPVASLVGPALLGLGTWAAAGSLTVEASDSAVRLAQPASVWWVLAGGVVGWLVPALRRRPGFALPALLPVVAWLPLPVPPVVLLWTGLLAWAPVGMALLAAVADSLSTPHGETHDVRPLRHVAAAWALTFMALIVTAWSLAPRLPSGDEPHYLMISASLLRDGDLKIANNHVRGDVAPYLAPGDRPHYIRPGTDGEVYSIHAPGIPVIILPAFALGGYRGAQLTIVLLASVTGALLWWLGWAATRDRAAAWFAWLAIVGSATFVIQGITIFPDGPGALCVAVALVALWTLDRRPSRPEFLLVAVSVLLAILPWMHSRFAVIAAGLGVLVVTRILLQTSLPSVRRWRRVAIFLGVPAVSAAAWLGYFLLLYGSANPSAAYGANPEVHAAYAPGGLAGLFFDQQFGLLVYSPVLAVAFLARRGFIHAPWSLFWAPLAVAAAYLTASATYWMWWAGVPAPPARLAAAVLPAFVVPIAAAFSRASPAARSVLLGLLVASLTVTIVLLGVDRGLLAWNTRDGYALWLGWLGSSADVFRGWPSFFWALVPGDVRSESTFVLHCIAWTAVGSAAVAVWRLAPVVRRNSGARALLLPLTLMAAVEGGWAVTGSTGIDAAGAQLRLLSSRDALMRIAPAEFEWAAPGTLEVHARILDRRQRTPDAIPVLVNVPAGSFTLDVVSRRPQTGQIGVALGRERHGVAVLEVAGRSRQSLQFDLPAGADRLRLTLSSDLMDSVERLTLVPRLDATYDGPGARAVLAVGAGRFHFVDDNVFVERDGFWVRGGQRSDAVFAPAAAAPLTLVLANGPAPNVVVVGVAGEDTHLALGSGEVGRVFVPDDIGGPIHFSITSPAGFRPSADGISEDARYLGVRVTVE